MPLKHPSNFELKVEAHDFEDFERALYIAFDDYGHKRQEATHYSVVEPGCLTLYWHSDDGRDGAQALPYPMDVRDAIPFVWNWLKRAKPHEPCPDIDGSVEPDGWRVETVRDGWSYAIARITKVWSLYHK